MFSPFGYTGGLNPSQPGLFSGNYNPVYPIQQSFSYSPYFSFNPTQNYFPYGLTPYFQFPTSYDYQTPPIVDLGRYPTQQQPAGVSAPQPDEVYQGVGLMTSAMRPEDVEKLKKNLDIVSASPDGQKLLYALGKGGVVMEKDEAGLMEGAFAQAGKTKITFGDGFFNSDSPDNGLEVMVHEMTHSAISNTNSFKEQGWSKDDEAMASVMGRRIRFQNDRYTHDVTLGDETFTYDGSPAAEQKDYELGVKSFANSPDYGRNPTVFDGLNELGIQFGFGYKE